MSDRKVICEIYHDHMENHKRYPIRKAQLIIADIPYNLGVNAYASNTSWYEDGDIKNGESKLAGSQFFATDNNFNIDNFFRFVKRLLKPEPKEVGKAPALIILCSFQQLAPLIEVAKIHGFKTGNHPLVFYRDKLPKFNNDGKMIYNHMPFERDFGEEKIHPTQKPVKLLKKLIELYTDEYDVVIDPVAGSASTLVASKELKRHSFGFEIDKGFFTKAKQRINGISQQNIREKEQGIQTIFDFMEE